MGAQAQERLAAEPIEFRLPPIGYRRSLRVTTHAIKRMVDRSNDFGIAWPQGGHETAAIGSAIDLLICEARARDAVGVWWDTGGDGEEKQVELATLDTGAGRPALHAVIVDNDVDDGQAKAVLTILYDRQLHASIRTGRFTKERRSSGEAARLVSFGAKLEGLAIIPTPGAAPVPITSNATLPTAFEQPAELTPPPVPDTLPSRSARRDRPAPRAEQHTAEVEAAGLVAAPGALITFQPLDGDRQTVEVHTWDAVPGIISDLVDDGIDITKIATYRLVPLKVRRAITVTLGEE
jgi:hypothetical protein